jgi:hypothetical protein
MLLLTSQIINNILPLEIIEWTDKEKLNERLNSESEEIKNLFLEEKTNKTEVKKREKIKQHNLFRLINKYSNEIPNDIQKEFLNHIENNYFETNIDFKNFNFPLEVLGDNIIKILYIWKPELDKKIISNFKYFYELFENELLSKDLIITKIIHDNSKSETKEENNSIDDDWNDIMNIGIS